MPTIFPGMEATVAVPDGRTSVLVFDSKLKGFFLRVANTGVSTYGVDYRVLGRRRRMSLGPATSATALTAARRTAEKVLAQAKLGQDVLAIRENGEAKPLLSFDRLTRIFLDQAKGRLRARTHSEWTRYLTGHLSPLSRSPAAEIQRRDIIEQLDRIAEDNGPVAADRAKTALSAFFAWCVEEDYCPANPVSRIRKRSQSAARERILSDAELATVWQHSGEGDYGAIVRLLILTGQRREEIGWLHIGEVDGTQARIILPPRRTKNGREHLLPLSSQAMQILRDAAPRNDREFIFGESGHSGYSGWSRSKLRIDRRIDEAQFARGDKPIERWTLHDLRRTFASGMARLGVGLPVIEKMLNHVSGTFSGVAGVYQRYSFEKEMRAAMQLWGNHVEKLTEITTVDDPPVQENHNIL